MPLKRLGVFEFLLQRSLVRFTSKKGVFVEVTLYALMVMHNSSKYCWFVLFFFIVLGTLICYKNSYLGRPIVL